MTDGTYIFPVDLRENEDYSITLLFHNGNMHMIAGPDHHWSDLPFGQRDVTAIHALIRKAIERFFQRFDLPISRDDAVDYLKDPDDGLVTRGNATLREVFGTNSVHRRSTIVDDKSTAPRFAIASNELMIPWECLFDASLAEVKHLADLPELMRPFWGMNRVIWRRRTPEGRIHPTNAPPEIAVSSTPRVGLIVDEHLEFARHEREMLRMLQQEGEIQLHELELDENLSRTEMIEETNRFLRSESYEMLHLACHAELVDEDTLGDSYFTLGQGVEYRIFFLNQDPIVHRLSPVVFFNACSSGVQHPSRTTNFVQQFQKRGVAAFIATDSSIDSALAARFASQYYRELVKRRDIGQALFSARQKCIENGTEAEDILSLFYCIFADSLPQFTGVPQNKIGGVA